MQILKKYSIMFCMCMFMGMFTTTNAHAGFFDSLVSGLSSAAKAIDGAAKSAAKAAADAAAAAKAAAEAAAKAAAQAAADAAAAVKAAAEAAAKVVEDAAKAAALAAAKVVAEAVAPIIDSAMDYASNAVQSFKKNTEGILNFLSGFTEIAKYAKDGISWIDNVLQYYQHGTKNSEHLMATHGIDNGNFFEGLENRLARVYMGFTNRSIDADEPGNYSASEIISKLASGDYKKADHPLTKDTNQIGPYTIPEVDQQIDKTKHLIWQQVTLDSSKTKASCSNGSDYKFFVNLTPDTDNFVIFFEGGGACFDYESCNGLRANTNASGDIILNDKGQVASYSGSLSASLGDGIPNNYLSLTNLGGRVLNEGTKATGLGETNQFDSPYDVVTHAMPFFVSPFVSRMPVLESTKVKVQSWNYIYMPYCTGDLHIGDIVKPLAGVDYAADATKQKTMHFKGTRNVLAMLGWMRTNLPKPKQLFVTGQSAGSAGAEMHRVTIRKVLNPDHMYAFLDSGFAFQEAPEGTTSLDEQKYPGHHVMQKLRNLYLNYNSNDVGTELKPLSILKANLPGFDIRNLNNISTLMNAAYPQDRTYYIASLNDLIYSSYAFQFNKDFDAAAVQDNNINQRSPSKFNSHLGLYSASKFRNELATLRSIIDGQNQNVGYYMPSGRPIVSSHVMTAINFDGTNLSNSEIQMKDVVSNLTDLKRPKLHRLMETGNVQWGLHQKDTTLFKLASLGSSTKMYTRLD